MVWHDLYIVRHMQPSLRTIKQKVFWLAGINISILMDVVSKCRLLTCVCQECSSKGPIKHVFHCATRLLSLTVELLKKSRVFFAFLALSNSRMQFP